MVRWHGRAVDGPVTAARGDSGNRAPLPQGVVVAAAHRGCGPHRGPGDRRFQRPPDAAPPLADEARFL